MRHLPTAVRSVRPTLADAVRSMLQVEPVGRDLGRTQAEGEHHHRLGTLFTRHGPDGVLACGREFAMSTSDPLVEFLATSRGPLQLGHRYRRIEPMFHLGHATETSVTESSMTFRHVAGLGGRPEIQESLLVCGATIGMFLRLGVSEMSVELTDARRARTTVWPVTHSRAIASAVAPLAWTVSWDGSGKWSEPLIAAKHEHLRALIATNPERTWDLRGAAAALGVSGRTLQRRLHADGTTLGQTVVAGRLDAATALLVRTSLDATTVALACGFVDLSHLTHHFRRRFGQPPGRYRAAMRGEA